MKPAQHADTVAMSNPIGIAIGPSGRGSISLDFLRDCMLPVYIEVAGRRYKVEDFDWEAGVFLVLQIDGDVCG